MHKSSRHHRLLSLLIIPAMTAMVATPAHPEYSAAQTASNTTEAKQTAIEAFKGLYRPSDTPSTPAFVALGLDPSSTSVAMDFKAVSAAISQITSKKETNAAWGASFNPYQIYLEQQVRGLLDQAKTPLSHDKRTADNQRASFSSSTQEVSDLAEVPTALKGLQISLGQSSGEVNGIKSRRALGVFAPLYDEKINASEFADCQLALGKAYQALDDEDFEKLGDPGEFSYEKLQGFRHPNYVRTKWPEKNSGVLSESAKKERDQNEEKLKNREIAIRTEFKKSCLAATANGLYNSISLGYAIGDGTDNITGGGAWLGSTVWLSGVWSFGAKNVRVIAPDGNSYNQVTQRNQQFVVSLSRAESIPLTAATGAAPGIYRADKIDASLTYFQRIRQLTEAELKTQSIGNVQLLAQLSGGRVKPHDTESYAAKRYVIGGDVQLPQFGGWLVFTIGRETSNVNGKWAPVGQMAFKYAFSDKALF